MRKFLISAAVLAAAAAAGPAAAQWGNYDRGYGYSRQAEQQIERRLDQLHHRIDRAADRGRLSRGEAISLQRQFDSLVRRYESHRRNGLSPSEAADMDRRIEQLRSRLEHERRDGRRWEDDRRWDDNRRRW